MPAALRLTCLAALLLPAAVRADPGVLEEFDIGRDGGAITLPVKVAGQTFKFLVVTAAPQSMVDPSLGAKVGVERVMSFVVGRESTFSSKGQIPLLFDLERVRQRTGLDVDGVLGMDFLSKYVVRIDFDSGRLTLSRGVGSDPGRPLPMHFESGIPTISADVAGIIGKPMRLNTGDTRSHSGSLDLATCDQLARSGKWHALPEVHCRPAGRTPEPKEGRLETLKLGPFVHRELYFDAADQPATLGLGYLKRYTVTFDFRSGVLYLRSNSRHSLPDQLPCSGLRVVKRDSKVLVESIEEGSPAERAGIRSGDEVISINGTAVGPGAFAELRELLKGEGRTVQVVIRRDSEQHEVPMRLESGWRMGNQGR